MRPPLPSGERVGVRGFRPLGPSPLTPPFPRWGEGVASGEAATRDRGRRTAAIPVADRARSALDPANLLLIACVAVGAWLVLVPVAALLATAFTEDTGLGLGAFTLDNFV